MRPLAMFLSEVDHEKYPEVTQKYRFEQVTVQPETAAGTVVEDAEPQVNPALLHFLEASGYDMQMECLKALGETAVQSDLDSVYVVLDMKPESGTIREQIEAVGRFLSMRNHYDGNRLR